MIIYISTAVIFILLILLCISLIIYFKCFGRADEVFDFSTIDGLKKAGLEKFSNLIIPMCEQVKKLPCEDVFVTSYDNLRLHGKLYTVENATGTIALFHGWRSSGINDFSCIIPHYLEMNYNVLLVSQRAHGKSEGKYICMGVKEKYDCKIWLEYIAQRFGKDHCIIAEGISMGGATVLMASELELPQNVKAIISDSGFTCAKDVVMSIAKQHKILPYPIVWFVRLWFGLFGGCSMSKDSTIKAMSKNTLPVLFIHGESDSFVPCEMTLKTYAAAKSDKYILTVPCADHGQSYLYDSKGCIDLLNSFLRKYT